MPSFAIGKIQEGQVFMAPMEILKMATEIGSFAMLIWLFYVTFSKTIPSLQEQFRQDLQHQRESTEAHLDRLSRSIDRLSRILLYHDATVRGVDPKALGSTEEILQLLRDQQEREKPR